ncbi:50S ribosomal protein L6 [Gammaproteobacteria bacterium]|nr:50S ribosomal protein L6 [Gammaproteobacteria bacterium]
MLRKANKPMSVPAGIELKIENDHVILSKGSHSLTRKIHADVNVSYNSDDRSVLVQASDIAEEKTVKAQLGTFCSHLSNMIEGLDKGFSKELLIKGTGYKAKVVGKKIILSLGYSHDVECEIPDAISLEMPSQTEINLKSHCKETLGAFKDYLIRVRKLCRFKGKGILDKSIPFVAKVVRKT